MKLSTRLYRLPPTTHSRFLMIGPPRTTAMSSIFFNELSEPAPCAASASVTFDDWKLLFVNDPRTVPLSEFEPSCATALTRGPAIGDSAACPATSTTISWDIDALGDQLWELPPAESRALLYHMPSQSSGLSVERLPYATTF